MKDYSLIERIKQLHKEGKLLPYTPYSEEELAKYNILHLSSFLLIMEGTIINDDE